MKPLAPILAVLLAACGTVAPSLTPLPAHSSAWADANLLDKYTFTGSDRAGNHVNAGRGYLVTLDFIKDYWRNLAQFGDQLNHPKPSPGVGVAIVKSTGAYWCSEIVYEDECFMRGLRASPQLQNHP